MARGRSETLRSDSLAMKAYICFQVTKPQSGMERMILKITISVVWNLYATTKELERIGVSGALHPAVRL